MEIQFLNLKFLNFLLILSYIKKISKPTFTLSSTSTETVKSLQKYMTTKNAKTLSTDQLICIPVSYTHLDVYKRQG